MKSISILSGITTDGEHYILEHRSNFVLPSCMFQL